jgi:hypothetical protein
MNTPSKSQWDQLLASRRMLLVLLFCVTGFLGLPLLWMSRAFTPGEKILWSVLNTLYTLALIAIVVGVCYWCYLQMLDAGIL